MSNYTSLAGSSELLTPIPSMRTPPQRLHWRAAAGFAELATSVRAALGLELMAASGWRPHRWDSRRHYEETLIRRYGSVAEGRRWLAFHSPHETGLAVDLGMGGLWPDRRDVERQRTTPLHRWLVVNAAAHGWYPYPVEPWHWEYPIEPSIFWSRSPEGLSTSPPASDACTPAEDEWIDSESTSAPRSPRPTGVGPAHPGL